MSRRAKIHILTGSTACGKTEAALAWAEMHRAEIVSCDALLFYRGMDIGTAKPSPDQRGRVPHHLIDVLDPTGRMDVKQYVTRATGVLDEIERRGRGILVVGGSGFYLKSFLAPVADDVPVDLAVRDEIAREFELNGISSLVRRLESLNPAGLGPLDCRNPRRVMRALERCLVSGHDLKTLAENFRAQPPPFAGREIEMVEIAREDEDLRVRISARVRAMLRDGLVEEVRTLRERGLADNPAVASAIGYRETLAWLDSGDTTEVLSGLIAGNTWRLVRKQRTWFRTQLPPHRIIAVRAGESPEVSSLFA